MPKEETVEEKYPPSESYVEEELLDQPAGTEDIIAPFSQWAEKKLVEEALLKDATKKESEPEVESIGAPSHPISNPSLIKTNGIKLTKYFPTVQQNHGGKPCVPGIRQSDHVFQGRVLPEQVHPPDVVRGGALRVN